MKSLKVLFFAGIAAALCVISAGATWAGVGTVTGDELRLRSKPNTNCATLSYASAGDKVVILEDQQDGWYKVDFDTQIGYMSADYITMVRNSDEDLGYGVVSTSGSNLNLRDKPDGEKIGSLVNGTTVMVEGLTNGWVKLAYKNNTYYASSDYIQLAMDSSGTRKDTQPGGNAHDTTVSRLAAKIIANAKAQLGKRYVWGAAGPSAFDCSGFTQYVARISGLSIPRGASSQFFHNPGKKITSLSQLRPGDFIYIRNAAYANGYPISHTMIYLGNNQIIHADSTTKRISIKSFQGYKKYFKGAYRFG